MEESWLSCSPDTSPTYAASYLDFGLPSLLIEVSLALVEKLRLWLRSIRGGGLNLLEVGSLDKCSVAVENCKRTW